VIARALAAACRDPDVLARLGGGLGEAVRAAASEEAAADRKQRVRWAMAARTPVPAGLRGVDASWLEAALAGLPARAREAVARGGGTPVDAWLARWATAAIPPMPAISEPRVTTIDSVSRVEGAVIVRWLADVGADQLALAFAAAGGGALTGAARVVGDRVRLAAVRITQAPRAGALGPVRAAIARCRIALDDHALARIGARTVAPYLEPLAHRRLVVRVPRALGRGLADELAAWGSVPLVDVPRWEALAAA
jgi:hypothetical protein